MSALPVAVGMFQWNYPNMQIGVVGFHGSNCDHDERYAFNHNLNVKAEFVWHDETSIHNFDAIVLSASFAYGDYPRCYAIAVVQAAGAVISGTVTFSMSPSTSQAISGVRIQGVAPGIGNFVASGVTLPANSLVTAAIPVTSDTALTASKTQFFSPETVTWDVSQNGAVCGSGCASAETRQIRYT